MTLCSYSRTIQLYPSQVISFSLSGMELRHLHLKGNSQVRIPKEHSQLLFIGMIYARVKATSTTPGQPASSPAWIATSASQQFSLPPSCSARLLPSHSQGDSFKTSITSCPFSPIAFHHLQALCDLALGYFQPPTPNPFPTTFQPCLLPSCFFKYANVLPPPLHFFPNISFFSIFHRIKKKSRLASLTKRKQLNNVGCSHLPLLLKSAHIPISHLCAFGHAVFLFRTLTPFLLPANALIHPSRQP